MSERTRVTTHTADVMFPDLPSHLADMAYALIDAGLCFLTCPPDCRGKCVEAAREAVQGLPVIPADRSEQ